MSKRITARTSIKDKNLAIDALKNAGYSYRDEGGALCITSGNLVNARINLATGEVSGDSDYRHDAKTMLRLQQAYAEAEFNHKLHLRGGTVESRVVTDTGEVKVRFCHQA